MKKGKIAIIIVLVLGVINATYSQGKIYSSISKNINKKAASLYHDLNKSGDTLELKSLFQLNRVEIIGDFGVKSFDIHHAMKAAKIPLGTLGVGEYTIIVLHTEGRDDTYIYKKTIVFKIKRLQPIDGFETKSVIASDISLNDSSLVVVGVPEDQVSKSQNDVFSNSEKDQENLVKVFDENVIIINDYEDVTKTALDIQNQYINESAEDYNKVAAESSKLIEKNEMVIYIPYNISDKRRYRKDKNFKQQSRAEYRRNHLRPNGKPYD